MNQKKNYNPRACAHCGTSFVPAHSSNKVCSDRCVVAANSVESTTHSYSGSSCLEWAGRINQDGYGKIGRRGKDLYAHRVSYEAHKQPIPADKPFVRHLCNNPSCVNPAHLAVGTPGDNMLDKALAGSMKGEKHPNARLTEAQARVIKISSEPVYVLAARYGVSRSIVDAIKRGRTWRHLS